MKNDTHSLNPDNGFCRRRLDHIHCDHWWEEEKCCACGHGGRIESSFKTIASAVGIAAFMVLILLVMLLLGGAG